MKKIYRFIFFKLMGWKLNGSINPEIKKCIIIVVPHTSWMDFVTGVFARGSIGLDIHYTAKKELFRWPMGMWFRWMGGTPLNRHRKENKVDAIAGIFEKQEIFRLAIAPEGTRKKVNNWKTGFYYIALKTKVPIIAVAFNYGKKEIKFAEPFYTTGDIKKDFKILEANYKGVTGFIEKNSYKND